MWEGGLGTSALGPCYFVCVCIHVVSQVFHEESCSALLGVGRESYCKNFWVSGILARSSMCKIVRCAQLKVCKCCIFGWTGKAQVLQFSPLVSSLLFFLLPLFCDKSGSFNKARSVVFFFVLFKFVDWCFKYKKNIETWILACNCQY